MEESKVGSKVSDLRHLDDTTKDVVLPKENTVMLDPLLSCHKCEYGCETNESPYT